MNLVSKILSTLVIFAISSLYLVDSFSPSTINHGTIRHFATVSPSPYSRTITLKANNLLSTDSLMLLDHSNNNEPVFMMMMSDTTTGTTTTTTISRVAEQSSLWISVGTGKIDWSSPGEALLGGITLLYFAVSIWAGVKYIIKDGWRPKL